MLNYELKYLKQGYKLIAGIDEAGRGPLAGPVCVACAIMPLENRIDGVNDSKKISEKKREILYDKIILNSIAYSCKLIDNNTIDEINILQATKKAMYECVEDLHIKPEIILIDAVKLDLDIKNESIIKGDTLSYNIAAASIIAKVTRDRIMRDYHNKYPEYDFFSNKGYGTKKHIEALKDYGATPIHRKSFITRLL